MILVLVTVLFLAAPAQAQEPALDAYREARGAGATGTIVGRIVAEPRARRAAGVPFTGATVTMLPHSDALLARLEHLKQGSRESAAAFTGAVPAMREARDGYEREIWEAGAADLTGVVPVDRDGGFRLEGVPAGAWIVIGWHSTSVEVSGEKVKSKERSLYRTQPRIRGFQSVTVWLRTLTVGAGEMVTLELTDRNAWHRGVVEERVLDTGR